MKWRNAWAAAACAVALTLTGGTPAAATGRAGLREVELGGGGLRVVYVLDMNSRGDVLGGLVDANGDNLRMAIWRRYDRPVVIDVPDNWAEALTDRGEVLGPSWSSWYWRKGRTYHLIHPSRSLSLQDRNDRGEMAGTLGATATEPATAYLLRKGSYIELSAPEGMSSAATKLNNRGEVLGVLAYPDAFPTKAFVWRNGAMTVIDLPASAGPESHAMPRDINDRGQAIINTTSGRPYLWDRGRLVDLLGGRPDRIGWVFDINNAGDVVGYIDGRPTVWRNGRATSLRLPAGGGWAGRAVAINERGDIAGRLSRALPNSPYSSTEVRVALWRDSRLLMSPSDNGEEIDLSIAGIDDRGRIAGSVSNGQPGDRQLVWVPARR